MQGVLLIFFSSCLLPTTLPATKLKHPAFEAIKYKQEGRQRAAFENTKASKVSDCRNGGYEELRGRRKRSYEQRVKAQVSRILPMSSNYSPKELPFVKKMTSRRSPKHVSDISEAGWWQHT